MSESEAESGAIGGNGSVLSSSSVHSISCRRLEPRIDSSALNKLSDQTPPLSQSSLLSDAAPLTDVQSRASLTIILKNLLHYSSPPSVRKFLPTFIADTLASDGEVGNLKVEVTAEEKSLIERSCAELYGICALVDYEASGLAVVADAVGALSCEALKADDKAFHAVDTAGYVDEEEVRVASDMRVLLTGYEAVVGKVENDSVSKIPQINGRLRKKVKSIHGMMRVELNSGAKGTRSDGQEAVESELSGVAVTLLGLGASSLSRVQMHLNVIGNEGCLKDELNKLFETKCVNLKELEGHKKLASRLLSDEEYVKFVHELHRMLGMVIRIVAWEGITAFFTLEGWDWTIADANAITDVVGNTKKKKTVRGKGNGFLVEFIKATLKRDREQGSSGELLQKYVDYILLCFDPKGVEFYGLVEKVKEIVEKISKANQFYTRGHSIDNLINIVDEKCIGTLFHQDSLSENAIKQLDAREMAQAAGEFSRRLQLDDVIDVVIPRGPVGIEGLLTTRWILIGNGQVVNGDGVDYTHENLVSHFVIPGMAPDVAAINRPLPRIIRHLSALEMCLFSDPSHFNMTAPWTRLINYTVRNQGVKMICWAFPIAIGFEYFNKIENPEENQVIFSALNIVECLRPVFEEDDGYQCKISSALDWLRGRGLVGVQHQPDSIMCGLCCCWTGMRTFLRDLSYYTVDPMSSTLDAILLRRPAIATMWVDSTFGAMGPGMIYGVEIDPTAKLYTHCVVILAAQVYEGRRVFVIQNSYGSGWGDGGFSRVFRDGIVYWEGMAQRLVYEVLVPRRVPLGEYELLVPREVTLGENEVLVPTYE